MRIAILSCGSILIREKEQSWLFGAPDGVKQALEAAGIEMPQVLFTTALRSPGYRDLGPILRFKESPLTMNGVSAKPIVRKHGTDFAIDAGHAKVLFSERGDVSVEDTEGYHLAIIKNKHRADAFGEHVITWPWKDSEYLIQDGVTTSLPQEIQLKVWTSMEDVPGNLKSLDGAALSLDQANLIARIAKASGEDGKENWAIGISTFKKSHQKDGDKWVKRDEETSEKMMDVKLSQELANYDAKGGEGIKACANCEYYCKDMTCCKVEGEIQPMGVCSLWEYGVEKDEHEMEEMPEPSYAYLEAEKEYAGDRPIPRIADIITAALHKAYNDTSDKLFQIGYLSQDERMKVAGSIGDGLDAFRKAIENEEFADRAVDKWDADQFMQVNKDTYINVYKSKDDDTWRWATITSTAAWDRQGELFSTKAMDWALGFSKMLTKLTGKNARGPLRYKHIPGFDGGTCETQLRVGDFLFEAGTFSDNKIGLAMRKKLKEDPAIWQISPGLAFAKHDLINGVYQRAAIFERSMTQRPANPFTIVIHKESDGEIEMKILTEQELKSAAEELGLEFEEAKMMYERALAAGSGPLGLKEFTEVVTKATGTNASGFPGGANSTHKRDDEDETEMLKEAVADLTEEELKHLAGLVEASFKEKGKLPPWLAKGDDKEAGEDEEEEMPMKKGKKMPMMKGKTDEEEVDEMAAMKELLAEQSKLIMQQTKAMGDLAAALAGGAATQVQQAADNLFNTVPRRQANNFLSTRTKSAGQLPEDDLVMQKLNMIEQQLKEQSGRNPMDALYDQFTSTQLNQPKRSAR